MSRGDDVAANTALDTTSKYARYCVAVAEARMKWPEWRRGQAHFNVLYFDGFDPEFADEIRGTDVAQRRPLVKFCRVGKARTCQLHLWRLDVSFVWWSPRV